LRRRAGTLALTARSPLVQKSTTECSKATECLIQIHGRRAAPARSTNWSRAYEVIFDFVTTRIWIAKTLHNPAIGYSARYDELVEVDGKHVWTHTHDVPHATNALPANCLREAHTWISASLKKRGLIES
jgi:hypothetical protein